MTTTDDVNAATATTRGIPIVAMPGSILIVPGGSNSIQTIGSDRVSATDLATTLQLINSACTKLLETLSNIQKNASDTGSSIVQNLKQ